MAFQMVLTDAEKGAAGRPLLSAIITIILAHTTAITIAMASNEHHPTLQVNDLPSINEADSASSSPSTKTPERSSRFQNVLRSVRPPQFTHTWSFFHEKNTAATDTYADRLTVMLENINTVKPFMELLNNFPLASLKLRDSIHFFKRGVRPVWEDPRNVCGGAWTFRVNKAVSSDFWREILYMAVGEQIGGAVSPGDDITGITLSRRFNSDLIMVWNRRSDADFKASIDAILATILSQLSEGLKPKEGTYYYKAHSEHAGFAEVVEKAGAGNEKMKETGA